MDWLFSWTTLNFIAGPVALASMTYMMWWGFMPKVLGMILFFVHATIFWLFVGMMNFTGFYQGPSSAISTWGAIIFFQLFATLIGYAISDAILTNANGNEAK